MLCDLAIALRYVINIYMLLLLVYAVTSWIPDLRRGRWAYYLGSIIEPVLVPIRRIIPPLGGVDLAFLVLLLFLQLGVQRVLTQILFNSCYTVF